ncbi:MAG TPA: hypothetical protein VFM59_02025 [Salinimicrobium sp.]|nr:hypothetical protein [Salinimicrobium sp.]
MAFLDDIKTADYWREVLKLSVIFFVLFVGFSLLISHFSQVFSGEFAAIYQEEWANGKWIGDLGFKLLISIIYSMYMVSRRSRFGRKE